MAVFTVYGSNCAKFNYDEINSIDPSPVNTQFFINIALFSDVLSAEKLRVKIGSVGLRVLQRCDSAFAKCIPSRDDPVFNEMNYGSGNENINRLKKNIEGKCSPSWTMKIKRKT